MNNVITKHPLLAFSLFCFIIAACQSKNVNDQGDTDHRPNIIYILADDLGYGDLGCYGQEKFKTPNIDRLASEGIRFTQHYSGSTVCAPSRSALMTGQHTGHTFIRGNKEWKPEGQWPLESQSFTMAELLQDAGYVTGAFGKWGLGYPGSEGDPNNQGFNEFYGYNCQRIAHHYYPYHIWDNQEKVVLKENEGKARGTYGPEIIHHEALKFLEENRDTNFFMFYPSLIPHAELFAPQEYMDKYRNKFLPEKEYEGVDDGERLKLGPYGSQSDSHAAFAAMIHYLDEQVGEIMSKLKELGIDDNTLVIFTSDNGPHLEGGADPDFFDSNGIYRGYKRDLYEGGIRVPMIARWPAMIQPHTTSDHMSAFWDVMPTVADILNMDLPQKSDGISFLPTLTGVKQTKHEYLYWEFHEQGGRQAVRRGDWKLVRYDVNTGQPKPYELYKINDDPGETDNLADNHPDKLEELRLIMEDARSDSDIFQFKSITYDAK